MAKDLGPRPCTWCGDVIPAQSPIGRTRVYCRPSCRQRALEARRTQEAIADAVAAAVDSSRGLSPAEAAAYPPLPPARPRPAEVPAGPATLF